MNAIGTEKRVTVLGAGRIGSALAKRWAGAGWDVVLWNRTIARAAPLRAVGVTVADSLADAVASATRVVSVLSDGPAVVETLVNSGVMNALSSDAVILDLSTIDVESTRVVADEAIGHGIGFVRGALSGSPPLVEAGRASALLSGADADVAVATILLTPVVNGITIVGGNNEAKIVKLAINALVGSTVLMLAEATVMIDASGVSRADFFAALEKSAIWSPVMGYKSIALRDRDFTITATTADLLKDVDLAVSQLRSVGVPGSVTAATLDALRAAASAGYADQDCITVASDLQLRAGFSPDVQPD